MQPGRLWRVTTRRYTIVEFRHGHRRLGGGDTRSPPLLRRGGLESNTETKGADSDHRIPRAEESGDHADGEQQRRAIWQGLDSSVGHEGIREHHWNPVRFPLSIQKSPAQVKMQHRANVSNLREFAAKFDGF